MKNTTSGSCDSAHRKIMPKLIYCNKFTVCSNSIRSYVHVVLLLFFYEPTAVIWFCFPETCAKYLFYCLLLFNQIKKNCVKVKRRNLFRVWNELNFFTRSMQLLNFYDTKGFESNTERIRSQYQCRSINISYQEMLRIRIFDSHSARPTYIALVEITEKEGTTISHFFESIPALICFAFHVFCHIFIDLITAHKTRSTGLSYRHIPYPLCVFKNASCVSQSNSYVFIVERWGEISMFICSSFQASVRICFFFFYFMLPLLFILYNTTSVSMLHASRNDK